MLGSKKAGQVSGHTTLVSSDTTIVGDLHFAGNLDIEGLVQGNVIAKPDAPAIVRIVGKGRVEGDIRAPLVVVNGEVKGEVYSAERLELAANARVEGNVFYALLEMSVGAEVNGNLTHIDPPVTEKAKRKRASTPPNKDTAPGTAPAGQT